MEYKIEVKEQGSYFIEVLRKESDNVYHLVWCIDLKSEAEVLCSQVCQNTKLVVYDWDGLFRVFDLVSHRLLFERDFNVGYSTEIQILTKKESVAIAYKSEEDRKNWLEVLTMEDFSTVAKYELPNEARGKFFQLGVNEEFLFYYCDNDDLGSTAWNHGYYKLDSESGLVSKYPLPNPQCDEFDLRAPYLNPELRLGVMPCWDKLEIKQNDAGEHVFVFKLSVFSLDDFSIVNTFPVREFKSNELSCQSYYCNEMEEGLLKHDFGSGKYLEAQREFIENLNSLVFDNDTYTFWICFRAGILINVAYNGTTSSQFEPESHPDNMNKGRDEFFHSYIHSWDKEGFILNEHWMFYRFKVTAEDLKSTEKVVYKPLEKLEEAEVLTPEEEKNRRDEIGKVVIEVADLETPGSYQLALDRMLELCKDICAIRSGNSLQFLVKDWNGNVEYDDLFFKKALLHKGMDEKINQLVRQFIAYERADCLYINGETTALAHAVFELAKADEKYAETAKDYFFMIDLEHDVFNQEVLVPTLCQLYPDNHHVREMDMFLREYHGCELGELIH